MAKTTRVISPEHLAKMQAGAKAARKKVATEGKRCGDCGRKVKPALDHERPYIQSSTRSGVIYCHVGTGCWLKPTEKRRKVADL